MIETLKCTWSIHDSYTDKETGFLVTEVTRYYGELLEAIENTVTHKRTQDLRFQFESFDDLT